MNRLPELKVAANRIVRKDTGDITILRGVNRSGLEYTNPDLPSFFDAVKEIRDDLADIAAWGANVIRLPVNQHWANSERYLLAIDSLIDLAEGFGMYTILDLQWLDANVPRGTNAGGTLNFVPPLPDVLSIDFWRTMARRYAGNGSVLFDLLNEPHDVLPDDDVPVHAIDRHGRLTQLQGKRVRIEGWRPWARFLIRTIREQNPDTLILVSGLDWGFDLSPFPLPEDGIIYSTHVYPDKGLGWDHAFGSLAAKAPVFVGEWGGSDKDLEWGAKLLSYMHERDLSWTAWSWSDWPHLVTRLPDLQPTAFGILVREGLRQGPSEIT